MASIRKRNNRWQVQVRSCIYGSISKSFHRKSYAQKWAIEQEALMQSGQWSRTMDRGSRVSDLLSKHLSDVHENVVAATTFLIFFKSSFDKLLQKDELPLAQRLFEYAAVSF